MSLALASTLMTSLLLTTCFISKWVTFSVAFHQLSVSQDLFPIFTKQIIPFCGVGYHSSFRVFKRQYSGNQLFKHGFLYDCEKLGYEYLVGSLTFRITTQPHGLQLYVEHGELHFPLCGSWVKCSESSFSFSLDR